MTAPRATASPRPQRASNWVTPLEGSEPTDGTALGSIASDAITDWPPGFGVRFGADQSGAPPAQILYLSRSFPAKVHPWNPRKNELNPHRRAVGARRAIYQARGTIYKDWYWVGIGA